MLKLVARGFPANQYTRVFGQGRPVAVDATADMPTDTRTLVQVRYGCGHWGEQAGPYGHRISRTRLTAMRAVAAAGQCPDCRTLLKEVRAVGEKPTIPTRTAQNRLMYSPKEAK